MFARFTKHHDVCEQEAAGARYRAKATCEVCGERGQPRDRPATRVTLCDDCFIADRAAAAERGERYAGFVLQQMLSGDHRFPDPAAPDDWFSAWEQLNKDAET